MGQLRIALAVAALVAALDQATKAWALRRLTPGSCGVAECIDVIGSLRFHLHFNPGASFGSGVGLGRWFGVLAIGMGVWLMWLAARSEGVLGTVLLGLVLGGAMGNLVDRVTRAEDGWFTGSVVDFIDLQWWPIFNVADMAIVGGVCGLVLYYWRLGAPEKASATQ